MRSCDFSNPWHMYSVGFNTTGWIGNDKHKGIPTYEIDGGIRQMNEKAIWNMAWHILPRGMLHVISINFSTVELYFFLENEPRSAMFYEFMAWIFRDKIYTKSDLQKSNHSEILHT